MGGNVAIGLTDPGSYKLNVAGSFKSTSGNSSVAINEYQDGAVIWLDGADHTPVGVIVKRTRG